MTEPPPPRLLDQPHTGGLERSLLEDARGQALEPPPGLQEALWTKLDAQVGPGAPSPGGAPAAGPWIGLGALVGAGALVAGLLSGPSAPSRSLPPPAAASAAVSVSASAPPPPPTSVDPKGSAGPLEAPRPSGSSLSLEDLPASPPSAVVRPPAPPASGSADVAGESALVQDARSKLRGGDAAGALSALAEADKRFPRGTLALERSVLRILALDRAGRKTEAAQQARAFLAAHPDSPHAERLQAVAK